MQFTSNGDVWQVRRVAWDDDALIDRTGELRVATTDPRTMTVYLADWLEGSMLARVLIHEMAHATMWSNGLIADIRKMVQPEHWVDMEEWICNFLADYGWEVYQNAAHVLGCKAMDCIPAMMQSVA